MSHPDEAPRRPTTLGRALLVSLVAALLTGGLIAILPGAHAAAPPTSRVLAITAATAHPTVPFKAFDGNPPKLFDIDGDGQQEVVAQNDNQWVYVFDSKTGAILFEAKTTLPAGWGARSFNGPEVVLTNQGGAVRLVVQNSAATVTSFRFDPVHSVRTHFAFVKEWERRLDDCHADPGSDSKPTMADLDKDGRLDIVAATEENGIYALRDNGQLLWKNCMGGGNAEPSVGDLDQDGNLEVVYGSDAGMVSALNGQTGVTKWSYNVLAHFNLGTGSMPVGATVAQLDGAAGPDVVVGVRDSHDSSNFANDHALLLALGPTGALLWGRQDAASAPLTYTHPIVVDADHDGQAEVYWGDWNTIGHKPPADETQAWKSTGPAHVYRYSSTGALVWRQTLDTWWSNKDLAVADVDADGAQDVLANGPDASGHDGIWSLAIATGAKEAFVSTDPWKVMRGPVVGDLYGGGTMQWIVEVDPNGSAADGPGILVYDTHAPYSAAWPHLPYATPGPAAPPPSGSFDATYTIKSPNEWWQEVFIQPQGTHPLANIQVRLDGGAWLGMGHASWGAWTSSYHSVAGTWVEFLATDTAGAQSQSAAFQWLDGTLTKGSVPPGSPTPSSFTATFTVSPNVNSWWVEVTVGASDPLSGVAFNVDGGPWQALDATDWGTWAKSVHVASGAAVRFQATSTTGATATSGATTWP